jgi:hypothetical protein
MDTAGVVIRLPDSIPYRRQFASFRFAVGSGVSGSNSPNAPERFKPEVTVR